MNKENILDLISELQPEEFKVNENTINFQIHEIIYNYGDIGKKFFIIL